MSSKKQFLLSFLICLAIFSVLGYFVIGYFEKNLVSSNTNDTPVINIDQLAKPGNNSSNSQSQQSSSKPRFVSALIVGKDMTESYPDALIIIKADRVTKKILVSSLPPETSYILSGTDQEDESYSSVISLRDTYIHYGIDFLVNKLYALTGVKIDHYAVMDANGARRLFDAICGNEGLKYVVPEKMVYEDGKTSIDLYEGVQYLNGNKAVQLSRYRTYADGNGNIKRRATQVSLLQALTRIKLNSENPLKAALENDSERKKLLSYVVSNATSDDIYNNLDVIFSLSDYEFVSIPYRYTNTIKPENLSSIHSDFSLPFKK